MTAKVLRAKGGEEDRLAATIVVAFSADPFVRWLMPDSHRYLAHFTAGARAHATTAAASGRAYRTAGFDAAAVWFAPGVVPDEAASEAFRNGIPDDRRESAFRVFDRMGASHPPDPFWHLRLLGVDPSVQGNGLGSALLDASLRDIEDLGLPMFLESTSPASRRLYERHGFVVLGEIQEGTSPPIWPMLRNAR